MKYDDTVILLYAKSPVAGKVNTRLIPDIGINAATRLQFDLIHHRLSMLRRANLCDVRLMCAPDQHDDVFLQCKKQYPVALFDQSDGDLGERMFNGIVAALQQYSYCIVIGTDAPALDEARIEQVVLALHDNCEVVLVPAEDGGYVLIAMKQAYEFLFQNISWGSAAVMQQTRVQLRENNVPFKALEPCWDVDTVEDYRRYLELEGKA